MYKRLVSIFCGQPKLLDYYMNPIRKGEVLIKIFGVYFSFIDRGIALCKLVSKDSLRVLGTAGMGKVVGVGISVDPLLEGKIVITSPICKCLIPIEQDGPAQTYYAISEECIAIVPQQYHDDPLAVVLSPLSIARELLEELKGAEVLLVGEDLSLLTFATYAQKYSSRILIIPKHTMWSDIIKGDHISLFDNTRKCDVIVIASDDPYVIELTITKARELSTIIMHPATAYLTNMRILATGRSLKIKTMLFGDLSVGIDIYETYRSLLFERLGVKPLTPELVYNIPSVALLETSSRYRNRKRK